MEDWSQQHGGRLAQGQVRLSQDSGWISEINQGLTTLVDDFRQMFVIVYWRRRMAADGFEGSVMEYIRLQKSNAYTGEDGESWSGDEEDFEEENVEFDEFGGSVGEDIEQTTVRVESEEDFACCEENGDMEQSTYTVECNDEIAGLLKHDVVRLSGEFLPTGNLHGVFAKAKTTRLGRLISCAQGLVLRNTMVVKNLVVLGTIVAKPLLQAAEIIANGTIIGHWQEVSTKRRRFGAGTGTIT